MTCKQIVSGRAENLLPDSTSELPSCVNKDADQVAETNQPIAQIVQTAPALVYVAVARLSPILHAPMQLAHTSMSNSDSTSGRRNNTHHQHSFATPGPLETKEAASPPSGAKDGRERAGEARLHAARQQHGVRATQQGQPARLRCS